MMCRGERQQWAQDLKRHCTLPGREKLYDSLFTLREMRTLKPKSYLMQSKAFCDFEVATPTPEQVVDYDTGSVSQAAHSGTNFLLDGGDLPSVYSLVFATHVINCAIFSLSLVVTLDQRHRNQKPRNRNR